MERKKSPPEAGHVRCMLARLTTPGADVGLALRHAVLRFASERDWLVVGGWAQELGLRDLMPAGNVRATYYDERFACRMSDVDALSPDPIGDLVELATRLHRTYGTRLTAQVGMSPNVYHLQAEGFGSLVDLQAVTPELFAAMPSSGPHALLLDEGGGKTSEVRLRTSRLATELATQYCIADNVLNWYHSVPTASYEKLATRIRAMEAVVPAALSTRPLFDQMNEQRLQRSPQQQQQQQTHSGTVAACGHHYALVRELPGDVMVFAPDAAKTIWGFLQLVRGATCRFYAPLDISPKYMTIVEIMSPDQATVSVFVTAEPVPIADGTTDCPVVSPRTAAGHLRATDIWRRRLADPAGAAARAAAYAGLLSELITHDVGADPPAASYAGTVPIEPVMARYMRTKGSGPQPFRYVTPSGAPVDASQVQGLVRGILGAASRLRGAVPDVRDGRFLFDDGAISSESDVGARLARASPLNLFSMDLHPAANTTSSDAQQQHNKHTQHKHNQAQHGDHNNKKRHRHNNKKHKQRY